MSQGVVQVPGPREWLWSFFPWGFLLSAVAVGSLTAAQYGVTTLVLAALAGVVAVMLRRRRVNERNFVRLDGDQLLVASGDDRHSIGVRDLSHIDWLPGSGGSPMWSPTATPPEVRVALKSGAIVEAKVVFATTWGEERAVSALRKAADPVVVRG